MSKDRVSRQGEIGDGQERHKTVVEPAVPIAGGKDLADPAAAPAAILAPSAEKATQPLVSAQSRAPAVAPAGRPEVRISPDLHDLLAGIPITPEEAEAFGRRRRLDKRIHMMLIVGLFASTATILAGLALDLFLSRSVPVTAPAPREVIPRILELRPSGFLALGLLMLIATPILRVVGSFVAFVHERDWRYAGVTLLVLMILSISLLAGRG
jgi:uncharacterized membrane protein